jgi:predicted Zn-dependent protease with MMP-like domain
MQRKPGWQRHWQRLQQAALQELDAVLTRLPAELKRKARPIPVTLEPVPGKALLDEGLEPDTLGLYVGEAYSESESGIENVPPQIVLFLENIWEYAGHDTAAYREEIRITYLHELGHYLGLDEDDLVRRELE